MSERPQNNIERLITDTALCFAVVTACLISQGAHRIWSSYPLELLADHSYILFNARMMMEGEGFWRSDIAGFPLGYSTVYFPSFEPLFRLVLMALARTGVGVFAIIKFFYVFGIGAIAALSFICLRLLDVSKIPAAVGAIAMVITPYFFIRALNHDFLAIYISAPVGVTAALLIARCVDGKEFQNLVFSKRCFMAALLIATCGLYYAFFSAMFIGCAVLSYSAQSKSARPLFLCVLFIAAVLAMLLIGALGPNIGSALATAPSRSAADQAYHGLSLADAIYVFDWIPAARRLIADYTGLRAKLFVGEGAHEWPGVILTLTILVSPLIVLCIGSLAARDRRVRTVFAAAAMICVGIIFATRGNLGFLFNELFSPAIRAQARIMPFLTFFSIVIICTSVDALFSRRRVSTKLIAASVLIGLLCSAIPASLSLSRKQESSIASADKQALVANIRAMLERKDAVGIRSVLQLPLMPWPEAPPINGFDPYILHYPFILDRRGSGTRWSYGASEANPDFGRMKSFLQSEVNAQTLAGRARKVGFDAVLLERAPLTPAEFTHVRSSLALSLPRECVVYEDGERILFDIGVSAECREGVP
ncbi:MAG TPA: hypothetical protein VIL69_07200 [Roseomonas sp.]|jgi:hypothetical protein